MKSHEYLNYIVWDGIPWIVMNPINPYEIPFLYYSHLPLLFLQKFGPATLCKSSSTSSSKEIFVVGGRALAAWAQTSTSAGNFSSIFTNSSSVSLEIFGGWGWETPIFMARLGMKGGEKSMGKCMGSEWHMQKILRKKRWSRELRYFIAKGWRMKLCNYPKLTQNWRATCQDILAQAWPVEKHGSSVIHLSLRNIFQVEHCPTKNDRREKRVKSSSPSFPQHIPKPKTSYKWLNREIQPEQRSHSHPLSLNIPRYP